MKENKYQARLIKKLYKMFPGCFILKNNANYRQGIPDLLILWNDRWAMLEAKASKDEPFQPNQEYYLLKLDNMSFAMAIYPEVEEEVLSALQRQFTSSRETLVSERQQVGVGELRRRQARKRVPRSERSTAGN